MPRGGKIGRSKGIGQPLVITIDQAFGRALDKGHAFRPMAIPGVDKLSGNGVQGFIPGYFSPLPRAFFSNPLQRVF
jgi:hypothetical protein